MVVNNYHLPFTVHMIPREKDLAQKEGEFSRGYGIGGPQRGTPFAAKVEVFSSPLSLPCLKPPYGEISVVDLTTQKIVWRRGLGIWNLGLPYTAGTTVTESSLIFMGGALDGYLRAIDLETGEELWKNKISKPSDGTPMSYVSPSTGKQYVIVTVPGQGRSGAQAHDIDPNTVAFEPKGGTVIAYTLNDQNP
jgi:glucose dehydrogenase